MNPDTPLPTLTLVTEAQQQVIKRVHGLVAPAYSVCGVVGTCPNHGRVLHVQAQGVPSPVLSAVLTVDATGRVVSMSAFGTMAQVQMWLNIAAVAQSLPD